MQEIKLVGGFLAIVLIGVLVGRFAVDLEAQSRKDAEMEDRSYWGKNGVPMPKTASPLDTAVNGPINLPPTLRSGPPPVNMGSPGKK